MTSLGTAVRLPIRRGATQSFPLDEFSSDAFVSYSVARRLFTSYTGPLFRVRRSSDSSVLDIYPGPDGWADQDALLTFVGAGNGDVTIVYDQLGGYNLLANGAMWVVRAGVSQTVAGKLSIRQLGGLGGSAYQSALFPSYTGSTLSCFARAQIAHTTGYARWVSVTDAATADYNTAGNMAMIIAGSGGTGFTSFAGVDLSNNIAAAVNTDKLVSCICDGANVTLRDGTNTQSALYSTAFNIRLAYLAGYQAGAGYGDDDCYYAELILWTSDQTSNEAAIRAALSY